VSPNSRTSASPIRARIFLMRSKLASSKSASFIISSAQSTRARKLIVLLIYIKSISERSFLLQTFLFLLYFSMSHIHWKFFMDFYQISSVIINFLIEFGRFLISINFLDIFGFPAKDTIGDPI